MATDKEILTQFINEVYADFQKVIPKSIQAKGLNKEVTDTTGIITAWKYINVLEYGRRPTKAGAKKGSPTLQQELLKWIESKGIVAKATTGKKPITQEALSWAMSRSIHKKGNLLWQQLQGQSNGLLSNVVSQQRINALLGAFGDKYRSQVSSAIVKQFG